MPLARPTGQSRLDGMEEGSKAGTGVQTTMTPNTTFRMLDQQQLLGMEVAFLPDRGMTIYLQRGSMEIL